MIIEIFSLQKYNQDKLTSVTKLHNFQQKTKVFLNIIYIFYKTKANEIRRNQVNFLL